MYMNSGLKRSSEANVLHFWVLHAFSTKFGSQVSPVPTLYRDRTPKDTRQSQQSKKQFDQTNWFLKSRKGEARSSSKPYYLLNKALSMVSTSSICHICIYLHMDVHL